MLNTIQWTPLCIHFSTTYMMTYTPIYLSHTLCGKIEEATLSRLPKALSVHIWKTANRCSLFVRCLGPAIHATFKPSHTMHACIRKGAPRVQRQVCAQNRSVHVQYWHTHSVPLTSLPTKNTNLVLRDKEDRRHDYRLTGVVVHRRLKGSEGGHYNSFFRSTDNLSQWFHADGKLVHQVVT